MNRLLHVPLSGQPLSRLPRMPSLVLGYGVMLPTVSMLTRCDEDNTREPSLLSSEISMIFGQNPVSFIKQSIYRVEGSRCSLPLGGMTDSPFGWLWGQLKPLLPR